MENGYLPDPFALETTENQIFAVMGAAKKRVLKDPAVDAGKNPRTHEVVIHMTEDPQRPIKRSITKVYRVGTTAGSEFLYYTQTFEGQAFGGQFVDHSQEVGKYSEPIFAVDIDRATGTRTVTGIRKSETRYEIPFTATGKFTDPSTGEETTLADLPIVQDCKFYAINNGKKYGLNVTVEEFANKSLAELTEFGKTGKWPTVAAEEVKTVSRGKKSE